MMLIAKCSPVCVQNSAGQERGRALWFMCWKGLVLPSLCSGPSGPTPCLTFLAVEVSMGGDCCKISFTAGFESEGLENNMEMLL